MLHEEIKSLDDDVCGEIIHMAHHSDPKRVYTFDIDSVKKSQFLTSVLESDQTIINNPDSVISIAVSTRESFMFVMSYLDFYRTNPELPAPEFPLSEDISDALDGEQILYGELLTYSRDGFNTKIHALVDITYLVRYLQLDILLNKIAAVIAHHVQKQFEQTE